MVEHRLLLRIQRQLDHPRNPQLSQHTGDTHGDTCAPVLAFENRDRRQNAVSPIGDRIDHLCNGHARRIAGAPDLLQTQNLAATLTCALHNPLYLLIGQKVRQRHRTDRTVAHQRHHAIAMPSEHQRGDIPGRKPCFLGNETLHARGIQHPRLAEHPVAAQRTETASPVGQHVDRVRHHQHRRRRGMPIDIAHDAIENWQIDAQHILTRLTRLARHTRGNHHQVRILQQFASGAAVNPGIRTGLNCRLPDIQRLALGQITLHINQHQLTTVLFPGDDLRRRLTYYSGTHNR
ncbi:hypothetical protein D3C77_372530 [compost metagenome]